ncbi:CARDB domain-containing protein, partial [Bacteroidota bacterium]
MDEFRFSEIARSGDWINQSYQMVENQGSLVNEGTEETFGVGYATVCSATFNITSGVDSGNNTWPIRCTATSSNTPNAYSSDVNLTINDHPTASFYYPTNGTILTGTEILNASSSTDDFNITLYSFELDNNAAFSSPSVLCSSADENCTFDTTTQTQCAEESMNCYLRLNVTDSDGLTNSTHITIGIDNTAPKITLYSPDNNSQVNSSINFIFMANDTLTNVTSCELIIDGESVKVNNSVQEEVNTTFAYRISLTGYYNWTVNCTDSMSNEGGNETRILYVRPPDLVINAANITLSDENPGEADNITIYATLFNDGGSDAFNVTVQFFNGDPDSGGVKIGSNFTLNLTEKTGNNSNQTLNVSWVVNFTGPANVFVVVDPPTATNGSIFELNESNNKASNTLNVKAWQTMYGDLFGFLVLEANENSIYLNWSGIGEGNVFVVDDGSSISFSTLQALGRDTSGVATLNDFSDLDTALNMSSYNDSVNILFADDTDVPRDTTDFIFYRQNISNVPIINSTNSSSFITGIFWDYSDDSGDDEYDSSDREDIVFVTKMNPDQLGKYGTYDYEMTYPVLLREYKSVTNIVEYYYEII